MTHKNNHQISVECSLHELNKDIQDLFIKATSQLDVSYAPYSDFNVGAALSLESGNTVVGCNQENASYPLCMCGERVALYNAGSNFPNDKITALVIICRNNKKAISGPVSPCGACRQVIHEFGLKQGQHFPIYLSVVDNDIVYCFDSIEGLLPYSFDSSFLK
jgi:cytidine deaminase